MVTQHQRPLELTDEELAALPVDRLGLEILRSMHQSEERNAYNWMNRWRNLGYRKGQPVMNALATATHWLYSNGLIAPDFQDHGSFYPMFITRQGLDAIGHGLSPMKAARRLDVDLHERIGKVRSQFLLGEYELAAFSAMREVEIRVRALAAAEQGDIGVTLMNLAFNPEKGKLTDTNAEAGERQGLRDLFAGAIASFKNPPSHRQVDFDDPTEAAEVVLFADLLLRILDRVTTSQEIKPTPLFES